MKCLYCSNKKTEVTNSRLTDGGRTTWRRRHCPSCEKTFTTRETTGADNLFVIKRNGVRQRFVYEKLFVSIFSSLNTKRNSDNGDNAKLAKKITHAVITKVFAMQLANNSIRTSELIVLIYKELKKTGKLYADHYLYYSDFRLQTGVREHLIR